MEKLFYTLKQYKDQARLYHKNMKEMGLDVSYMQAMQLLAKSLNYKSWEILETKVLENELAFKVNSSSEITLNIEKSDNLWITVNNISVGVKSTDEGVVVDLYSLEKEDNEPLASTYAFYAEAENTDLNKKIGNTILDLKDNEEESIILYKVNRINSTEKDSQQEILSLWEQSNKKFKHTVRAYDIKKGYDNSSEKDMYNFQEYMMDNLMAECGDLFKNRNEAKDFLFKKDNEHIVLPTYHTKEFVENIYHNLKKGIYSELKSTLPVDPDIILQGEVRQPIIKKHK